LNVFFNVIIRRRLGVALALLFLAGCGDDDNGGMGGPTPPTAPQITCPANVSVTGVVGSSQAVSFAAPTVSNGTAPVVTTCNPASGSSFPLGTTPVTCIATDAQQRTATCSFSATLAGAVLGAKKYMTVGDSLTQGENGLPLAPTFIDTPNAYPTKLQALFDRDFPGQGIAVINRGVGGQRAEVTRDLLPGHLLADRPEAVLILTGYNNLTQACSVGFATTFECGQATDFVAFAVRDCIREAKESPVGVKFIFVSTLTPPGPTGSKRIDRAAIEEVNHKIRQHISQERVVLADNYVAFVGHEAQYVAPDGLHLLPPGYQAMADTFYAAIRATVPQSSLSTLAR